MKALICWLLWLPNVLPAMVELPKPVNLTLRSKHFRTMLKWEPGPGTPTGAYYQVVFGTDRGTSMEPVSGCEQVTHPLVCNMSRNLSDPNKTYLVGVTTLLGAQKSQPTNYPSDFTLIRDSHLDLPLLIVSQCDMNLCVDLQFPKLYKLNMSQYYKDIYNSSLKYRIKINDADIKEIRYLNKHTLMKVMPGKKYCVSICFWDTLESKTSNYSQPVCVSAPDTFSADPFILTGLCILVLAALVIVVFLFAGGFIYPIKRPLPQVLTSVPHLEDALVLTSSSMPLSSVLTFKANLPSTGKRKQSQSSSDESDEESETESASKAKVQYGAKIQSLSSVSSLSSLSPLITDINTTTSTQRQMEKDIGTLGTTETDQAKKDIVEEVYSQDVNLLTLTFGRLNVEKEDNGGKKEELLHPDVAEVGTDCFSLIEDCSVISVQPSKYEATEVAAPEPMSCSADEEDEEEQEEDSAYMGRPSTAVLERFL